MACPSPGLIVHFARDNSIKYLGHKKGEIYRSGKIDWARVLYEVPCQKCLNCRLSAKSEWAARIVNEAQMWSEKCFISLTYDDQFLPLFGSLDHSHWQKFAKRLRRSLGSKRIKFFAAAEYGDSSLTMRPHFHAIVFGHEFKDMEFHHVNKKGNEVWTSKTLQKIWGKGFVQVGSVTYDSAAYCASYLTKKADGDYSKKYEFVVEESGEIITLRKEYARPSGGVGLTWLKEFASDLLDGKYVVDGDRILPVPRYYKKKLKEMYPELYEELRKKRIELGNQKNNRQIKKGDGIFTQNLRKAKITKVIHKKRESEL